jgi:predicted small secreted protein
MKRFYSLALAALLLAGCNSTTWQAVGHAVLKCGADSVANTARVILPSVLAVLNGGEPGWEKSLATLEATGVSAVLCAVQEAVGIFSARQAGPDAANAQAAAERGRAYLAAKGVRQ